MVENLYLIYSNYGIKENEDSSAIILKAAKKAYRDFCRRVYFQKGVSIDSQRDCEEETEMIICDMIPSLFEITEQKGNMQDEFDKRHHEICQAIIKVYEKTGGQPYGVAQRWLNLTLMNLVVIETNLKTDYWNISKSRKYFHPPVDGYLIEAAAGRSIGRYRNGLNIRCAPLKHDRNADYQMDWFYPGKTQPFEYWEYAEYIDFQLAVRNRLKEMKDNHERDYIDPLDWAFRAYLEVSPKRYGTLEEMRQGYLWRKKRES